VPAAKSNHDMLDAVLTAEQQTTKDYTQRVKKTDEFGDKEPVVQWGTLCVTKVVIQKKRNAFFVTGLCEWNIP